MDGAELRNPLFSLKLASRSSTQCNFWLPLYKLLLWWTQYRWLHLCSHIKTNSRGWEVGKERNWGWEYQERGRILKTIFFAFQEDPGISGWGFLESSPHWKLSGQSIRSGWESNWSLVSLHPTYFLKDQVPLKRTTQSTCHDDLAIAELNQRWDPRAPEPFLEMRKQDLDL